MVEQLIEQFTYAAIFLILFIAGLGVPIPEEGPILAAGVLSQQGIIRWWIALPLCYVGVLAGDTVLYWVGHHWGERILDWQIVRLILSPEREQKLMAAYRRHGAKIVVTGRHVMGLRAAAFLTAGIARIPFVKFIALDGAAALVGVPLGFGLAFFFTDQLQQILDDVQRVERWAALLALMALAGWLAVVAWRRNRVERNTIDRVL